MIPPQHSLPLSLSFSLSLSFLHLDYYNSFIVVVSEDTPLSCDPTRPFHSLTAILCRFGIKQPFLTMPSDLVVAEEHVCKAPSPQHPLPTVKTVPLAPQPRAAVLHGYEEK